MPLTALDSGQRAVLATAIASMGPQARRYKDIEDVADDLVAWLRRGVS